MSYVNQEQFNEFIDNLNKLGVSTDVTDQITENAQQVADNVNATLSKPIVNNVISNYNGDLKADFINTVQWYISNFFSLPFTFVRTPETSNLNEKINFLPEDVKGTRYLTISNGNIALPAGGYIVTINALGNLIEPVNVTVVSLQTSQLLMDQDITSAYVIGDFACNIYQVRTFMFPTNTDLVVRCQTEGVYQEGQAAIVVGIRALDEYAIAAYVGGMAKIQGR